MKQIITINRTFGSGGREVGKRLADELNIKHLDKELINSIYKKTNIDKQILKNEDENVDSDLYNYSLSRSFATYQMPMSDHIQLETSKIIKEQASKNSCVIVGRCADYILRNENPFKVYIYSSDDNSRIERCFNKIPQDRETKTPEAMLKEIKKIDKKRSKYYSYYTGGDKDLMNNYNLCIDTSKISIKNAVKLIIEALKLI